jgi:prepilin-type N-terminal cleavage/methylation domain-containing protein
VIVALRATPALGGGFTLLEMLMSVVLLALLLAGAYGGIQTSVRAMHSGEHIIDRVDRMRTAQEFVRHQLSRIMPLPYEQTLDNNNYVFEGDRAFKRRPPSTIRWCCSITSATADSPTASSTSRVS